MSNDLVERNFSDALVDMDNTKRVVEQLLRTKHYQKIGEEGIYAMIAKARALHIDPMHAVNGGLYFVQGRVGMSTEMMASLIRQQGHSIIMDEKSGQTLCILRGKRRDTGDTWISRFSVEDAKRAGIYNDKTPWGKYPDVMCYNRAMSKLARQLFPDIIQGAGYTKDELVEIASRDIVMTTTVKEENAIQISQKISNEQLEHLENTLKECDPKYSDLVKSHMRREFEVDNFNMLTQEQYERILYAAQNRIKDAQEKKSSEFREAQGRLDTIPIAAAEEQADLFEVTK